MSRTVSIVNYDMGNIYSIANAVRALGFEARIVDTPEDILASDLLILPGVGAYRDAMTKLRSRALDTAIREYVRTGKALLGICLGMQLLFDSSEENGGEKGLGILSGSVLRFPSVAGYRIPQIQWNQVEPAHSSEMFDGVPAGEYFYFLHSYFVSSVQDSAVVGVTNYCGTTYCSAIECRNVWGAQFHPERSGPAGLRILVNFLKLGEENVDR